MTKQTAIAFPSIVWQPAHCNSTSVSQRSLLHVSSMSSPNSQQGLQAFRIAGLPSVFYYIPNFISSEEEASILQKVSLPQLILWFNRLRT
jgi:hypothetical protein